MKSYFRPYDSNNLSAKSIKNTLNEQTWSIIHVKYGIFYSHDPNWLHWRSNISKSLINTMTNWNCHSDNNYLIV